MTDGESKTTRADRWVDKVYNIDQSPLLSLLYNKGYLHGLTGVPNIPLIQGEVVSRLDVVYNSGYCDGAMERIGEDYPACAIGVA